jgi:hypothetical protein
MILFGLISFLFVSAPAIYFKLGSLVLCPCTEGKSLIPMENINLQSVSHMTHI